MTATVQGPDAPLYAAFISYRHREADRRWAQWLVEALETWRTPDRLVRAGYPASLGRVFRDDDELNAVAELTPAIRNALWNAAHLLVVCSPETPASTWVRAEIRLFQHWGRADRILPVLIDGDPARSFPPELIRTEIVGEGPDAEFRIVEPRAADGSPRPGVSEAEQREHVLLTLAASLLGCTFAELRDRHEERERKLTDTAWFEDINWRHGAPEGVGAIDEARARRRLVSYRFSSRGGRVVQAVRVNNAGVPEADTFGGVCQWDVTWREDGSVEFVEERDVLGRIRLRRRLNPAATVVDLTRPDDTAWAAAGIVAGYGFDNQTLASAKVQKTSIVRHLLDLDDHGRVVRRRYCRDAFNTPAPDAAGHYGEIVRRDEHGRILEARPLDADGRPMVQRNGVAVTAMAYDDRGRMTSWRHLGPDGSPTPVRADVCGGFQTYDADGNLATAASVDAHGRPTLDDRGFAEVRYRFDPDRGVGEEVYLDADGAPVLCKELHAGRLWRLDERGRIVEVIFIDAHGAPAAAKPGYATVRYAFDSRDQVIHRAFYAADGRPTVDREGVHAVRIERNAQGDLAQVEHLDVDGAPCVGREGYASLRVEYDARGDMTRIGAFGVDGTPVIRRDGYAVMTHAYDLKGNCIQTRYFGADGAPCTAKDGYARIDERYDEAGQIVERRLFGADDLPIAGAEGYAVLRVLRDGFGHPVRLDYFDTEDRPTLCRQGYAILHQAYDGYGNLEALRCLDAEGRPIVSRLGFASAQRTMDARGQLLSESFFGVDGEPILGPNGYARLEFDYDARGGEIEQRCLGLDGEPVMARQGYARLLRTYDARGAMIEARCLGPDGAPCLHRDGWAVMRMTYDARGNPRSGAYFGIDGRPAANAEGYARVETVHDERDNQIEAACFGPDGQPCLNRDGYARERVDYDPGGGVRRAAYFGVDDAPVLRERRSADEDDHLRGLFGAWRPGLLAALGVDPEAPGGAFAVLEQDLDARGVVRARRFLGLRGEPVDGPEGFCRYETQTDARARLCRIAGYTVDGRVLGLDLSYTPYDEVDRVRFTDAEGASWTSPIGVPGLRCVYGASLALSAVELLDPHDQVLATIPA